MSEPKPKRDRDERIAIPLDPEEATRASPNTDPETGPVVTDKEAAVIVRSVLAGDEGDVPEEIEAAARQETQYPADETDEG